MFVGFGEQAPQHSAGIQFQSAKNKQMKTIN